MNGNMDKAIIKKHTQKNKNKNYKTDMMTDKNYIKYIHLI